MTKEDENEKLQESSSLLHNQFREPELLVQAIIQTRKELNNWFEELNESGNKLSANDSHVQWALKETVRNALIKAFLTERKK